METLAAQHVAIGHSTNTVRFTRMWLEELLADVHTKLDGTTACLVAEPYDTTLVDNKSNNLLAERLLAFSVVKKVNPPTDRDAAVLAEATCEEIALDILGRMRQDRLPDGTTKVFGDLLLEQVEGTVLPMAMPGWVGFRIQVPAQNVERRAVYRANRWNLNLTAP
jgi:hypothetical protein